MDCNSVIGIVLICVIVIAYSIFTQPSAEERAALKHQQDSIATVAKAQQQQKAKEAELQKPAQIDSNATLNDSAKLELQKQKLGDFAASAEGSEKVLTMENDLFRVNVMSKGGRIKNVELKKYKTPDGRPVVLMNSDSAEFGLSLSSQNRIINTNNLFFQPEGNSSSKNITLRLYASSGKYIEYIYSIDSSSYLISFNVNVVGLNDVIASNATYISFDWKQ